MIPQQDLKELLANGHFHLNKHGLDILRSHIELYELLDVVETELAESCLEVMKLHLQGVANG